MSTSWSYSAYSSAVRCLRLYKYTYIDKLVPEGASSSDLIFGSALHSAINACLTGQNGAAVFEMYWSSYRDKDVEYKRYSWEDLARLGAEFLRKFEKSHAKRYELEAAEKRLFAEYKGVKLEGTPDYFGKYDGLLSLRDFKTSGANYAKEKALIALQLNLYAYLSMQNGFKTPETLGYTVFNKYTGSIQDLTWRFSENNMLANLDDLVQYCESVDARKNHPRNLNACLDFNRKCQFWDLCHGSKENE